MAKHRPEPSEKQLTKGFSPAGVSEVVGSAVQKGKPRLWKAKDDVNSCKFCEIVLVPRSSKPAGQLPGVSPM